MSDAQKLVVFDWNGTLFDDAEAAYLASAAALDHYGVKDLSLTQFQEGFRVPIRAMYEYFGVGAALLESGYEQAQHKFHDCYEAAAIKAALRKGAEDVLAALKACGAATMILSNHLVDPIRLQLERLGIAAGIDHVSAYADRASQFTVEGKGARLGRYMHEHGIAGADALIIGDTPEEIEIAREYGMTGIAISGGFATLARLEAAQPDHLVHSMPELHDVLRQRRFVP